MDLREFDPLEGIQRRRSESPVNQRAQLKNERNSQIATVNDATHRVERVHEEATSTNLWQTNPHLVSLKIEIGAQEQIECNDPSIVSKCVTVVFGVHFLFSQVLCSCIFQIIADIVSCFTILLWSLNTIVDSGWKSKKDKVVRDEKNEPEPVKLKDSGKSFLLTLRYELFVVEEVICFLVIRRVFRVQVLLDPVVLLFGILGLFVCFGRKALLSHSKLSTFTEQH